MPLPRHLKGLITRIGHSLPFFPRFNRAKTAVVTLDATQPIFTVSPYYLSYSIDISVLVGGFWWEGSMGVRKGLGTLRVPPLDLNNKKLDRLVDALGPAYIRVGGSEADKIVYFEQLEAGKNELVLTKPMWDQLHGFIQRNNLALVFTFKYGLFNRQAHGEWDGIEIQKLLEYSNQKGYKIAVCELGNELNAYWAFHGVTAQPSAKNLAIDYSTFAKLIKTSLPEAKIMGPGSAFWPKLGETLKPLSNLSKKFLANLDFEIDIVSWHYYPFQSRRSPIRTRTATLRSLLSPKSYGYFTKYAEQLRNWRDRFQPQADLWAGETGSAQCGGQPQLSDRFASCFWWADQLGQGAALGQKVMIRQSLIGGDYGMINRLTIKPRPDYWVSWLWARLMGTEVYAVSCSHKRLRVYCHQHPNRKHKTVLFINSSRFNVDTQLNQLGEIGTTAKIVDRYVLTASSITANKIFINNKKAKFRKGKVNLSDFNQFHQGNSPLEPHDKIKNNIDRKKSEQAQGVNLSILPHSISFYVINHQ
ncbi:glycoside hydrolase [Algibacillus agarilyticus]|uniref:glycoside hydrolase n=1 Tax=Algibacillus agarilyticus TaxID=2234133 RepID=UPI000DD078ED|nr:glycoside hydrolase [Algibacillus agarilyticus]